MIITIDIGNTNVFVGLYEGEQLLATYRTRTDSQKSSDDYAFLFRSFVPVSSTLAGGIIASVVPSLSQTIRHAVTKAFGITPLLVGPKMKTGLPIRMDHPNEVGADLVAVSVAAKAQFAHSILVIDLGTASKIMAVDQHGSFVGGIVMPGLKISTEALVGKTAQLPEISLVVPPYVIGKNTPDAMNSGTLYGHIEAIKGLCARMEEELGYPCTRLLTGGYASYIKDDLGESYVYLPNLILEGLRLIYEKNEGVLHD